jgi:hypothetical protein
MGGPFPHGPESAPDPRPAVEAAIREGVRQAEAAVQVDQQEAAAFMNAHGAAVLGGHPDVRRPGRQGDPDPTLDAADG